MSGTLTTFGRQQLLLASFQHDVYVPPASLYFTVTYSIPVSNATGADLDEPDVSFGFARAAYPPFGADYWLPTGFGEIFNAEARTIAAPNALVGLIQGYAITDDETIGGGNVWAIGSVVEPYILDVDIETTFDVGDILIGIYD